MQMWNIVAIFFCHQVAALWAANVSAFIGPQETCVHEGRMAAAFNLPMISYVCIILTLYSLFNHIVDST